MPGLPGSGAELSVLTAHLRSCGQHEETEVFVESGSTAVLPCEVYSPDAHSSAVQWTRKIGGKLKTVWRRNRNGLEYRPVGKSSRTYCPQPNFGKGTFSLHMEGVREEDGGEYYCVVQGKTMHTKAVMLRVVRVSFTPAEVVEGDSLTVTCSITPQPYKAQRKWDLNGSQKYTWTSSQSLTLKYVSQKESGTWKCVVRNSEASGEASASLQVKGILVPKGNHEVMYAEMGSSVTLPCIFSNGLIVNSISWKKESSATGLPLLFPTSFKSSSGLSIESVEEEDTYKCSGQIETAKRKRVRVERYIQLVTARVLSSSRSGQLTMTCELSNSSRVTHYEWLRLDYGENDTQTLITVQTSTSKVLNIPKGDEKHLSGWVCRFYEHQRLLGNATYHQPMISRLEEQKMSGSGRKMITVIGLSVMLLLVVLIMLQMYKNHRRRKMIMQYPAMETIVHLAANERERRERSMGREELKASCSADLKSLTVIS
ncbi:uncharacterized protein [Salminus brasiliensis]|uniref:uncharacterized protein n=1 Tax=Salminus brasiliensis TaxID=930266 RepID=UPI003B838801